MKNHENKEYIKIGITGICIIAGGLLCYYFLFRLKDLSARLETIATILSPFLYGAVIAYILTPFCNRLDGLFLKLFHPKNEKNKILSFLSIAISLILILTIIFVLVVLVLPQLWDSIVNIINAIPGQLASANSSLHNLLKSRPELQAYWDDFYESTADGITEWLKTDLMTKMGTVINELGSGLATFLAFLKNLFLGILISAYFLANRKQFAVQSKILLNGIFPQHWAKLIEEEMRFADKMFNGFLMGKLLDSAIIGIICFVASAVFGFKPALLISVVVGVTNIIPFFGPFIGAIPCAIIILLDNPMQCLYFLIFIVILQQLDGNVIGPKILGNTTGLSSVWVLFAILLFGGIWGIFGMIVGVPLFAVIYDIIRRLTFHGIRMHNKEELIVEYQAAFHPEPDVKKKKQSNRAEK